MASPQPAADSAGPSPGVRSVLSLLLFIHLFCVFVVLGSTFRRSMLQARLVSLFGPYTQLLYFDPGYYTPYAYTQGRTGDDDAIVTVELYPDGQQPVAGQTAIATVTLPEGGSRWLADRRRAIALARRLAAYADPENDADELSGEVSRGIGAYLMREHGARRAVVRCIRRLSQPLDLATLYANFPPDDPTAAAYNEVLYEADVWIDEDGEVQAQRRQAAAEVAPRRAAGARSQQSGVRSQTPREEAVAP